MKSKPHTNPEDYFDYLAEMGNASISPDDLKDLNERIDKKVNSGTLKTNSNVFTTVLVVAFTAMLLFVLFNKNSVLQIGASGSPEPAENKDLLSQALITDSINSIETEKAPIEVYVNKTEKKDHFVIENRDDHFSENVSFEMLTPKDVTMAIPVSKPITFELVELLPNSSILYICDLKVTDFQKLYFKKAKPYVLEENGLSAAFENTEVYRSYKNDNKIFNEYTLDMLLKDALKAFNKSKYKLSFVLFEELLYHNENDVNALFYSGLSQYYMGENEDAIARFNKVLQSENNVFNQEAEWYKALALNKNGDKKECIELLLKINKQKGFYAEKAAEKLEELKKSGK